LVFSEDEKNRCQQVLPPEKGGWSTDGLFNDDFHHTCRVAATGNSEGYYRDYTGSPQELISLIRYGHLYQGQWNPRQGRIRGFPTLDIPASHFIHYLQNHDQVANSARGYRTHLLTSPGRHRALTSLLLLGPETPMLFMGQEFGASNPFLYFADHEEELARLVCTGRREFMHQFPRIKSLENVPVLCDPADEGTFLRCKLDWDEWEQNASMVELHRDLIKLRREDARIARQDRFAIQGSVIGPEAFALRWFGEEGDDRLALFNLGRDVDCHPVADPMLAAPSGRQWEMIWSSEDSKYGGMGTPQFDNKNWYVPGHAAVLFTAGDL
jgi:maltooligosyltrehalose trehalohydrolase